ncbi:MAG: hypothetical protein ACRBF0_20655 [Calditrichia bacterium]
MKILQFTLCLIMLTPSFAEEKVKQNYSKTGLEGGTKIEFNMPNFRRNQPQLNDAAYRFTVTPNYTFYPLKESKVWGESGISVGYIGIYDFYFGTRNSGPVVSRNQNPLLYLFTEHAIKNLKVKAILGLGHESNGQFISTKNSYDVFEEAFADSVHGTDPSGENPRFYQYNIEDWASMGWNYFYTEWIVKKNSILGTNALLSFNLHLRWFFKHGTLDPSNQDLEDNIFYDRELDGKTSIRDYDGFRYTIDWRGDSRHFNFWKENYLVYDPSFTIGFRHGYLTSDLSPTIWAKVYLKLLGSLPMFYRYDSGYGRDLSNYPYRFSSHAIGVEIRIM